MYWFNTKGFGFGVDGVVEIRTAAFVVRKVAIRKVAMVAFDVVFGGAGAVGTGTRALIRQVLVLLFFVLRPVVGAGEVGFGCNVCNRNIGVGIGRNGLDRSLPPHVFGLANAGELFGDDFSVTTYGKVAWLLLASTLRYLR